MKLYEKICFKDRENNLGKNNLFHKIRPSNNKKGGVGDILQIFFQNNVFQ